MFVLTNDHLKGLREGETLEELSQRLERGEHSHVLGVDLGQAADYTAICLIRSDAAPKGGRKHDLIHLERCPLGSPYPKIVERVNVQVHDRLENYEAYLAHGLRF